MKVTPEAAIFELALGRDKERFTAQIAIAASTFLELASKKETFLHSKELEYYQRLVVERRQYSFLQGRYVGKAAILSTLKKNNASSIFLPNEILIGYGVFEFPIIEAPSEAIFLDVGISHSHSMSGSVAFPRACPVAIDVEKPIDDKCAAIESQMTDKELMLIPKIHTDRTQALTILWAWKEALSKVLRCGMMVSFKMLEISQIGYSLGTLSCEFRHFHQYKAYAFFVESFILALVIPKNVEIIGLNQLAKDIQTTKLIF